MVMPSWNRAIQGLRIRVTHGQQENHGNSHGKEESRKQIHLYPTPSSFLFSLSPSLSPYPTFHASAPRQSEPASQAVSPEYAGNGVWGVSSQISACSLAGGQSEQKTVLPDAPQHLALAMVPPQAEPWAQGWS